jgi:hypothetical protein
MTPRDLIRRMPLPAALLVAALLALAPAVQAAVTSVSVTPSSPATCDPVTLRAEGATENSCLRLENAEVFGPEPIREWVGPLPAYRFRIVLTVREQATMVPCALVATPYVRDFAVGRIRSGLILVTATERVLAPDGTVRDSSMVGTSFTVSAADSCTDLPCVFLAFSPASTAVDQFTCTTSGQPGGEGCFDVALANTVPVVGVQLRIRITDSGGTPVPASFFTPKSVTTTPRSEALQAAWESDGSTVSVILFSPTDAVILPGRGTILRFCYSIGQGTPTGVYEIGFEKTLVADSEGRELPLCPTFRVETGRFCVGARVGCDLNGDGVSDIRDIVRLVRCALAGAACPDTVAARADCNSDGAVDVRDVICCVRKLLSLFPRLENIEPPPGSSPTRIGFTGEATWQDPISGSATLEVDPEAGFGAVEFGIEPPAGTRVRDLELEDGQGLRLEWARDTDGSARAVVMRLGAAAVAPARVSITFEPFASGGGLSGMLRISGARSASWDGAFSPSLVTVATTPVAEAAIRAPAVYAARPNPFSGTTEIPFALPEKARASLRVYDAAGRLVRTLADGDRPAGVHRVSWDGRDARGRALPAGIYFVKLDAAGIERTSRIIKLR